MGTLSGGNQQKVILARELGRDHKVLVASQPTRGLDVGSIEFVHKRIVQQRDHGVAVLIVSAELDEIYALADRIAVMYEGKITGFRPPTVPAEELGLLMAGASDDAFSPVTGQPGDRDRHPRAGGGNTRSRPMSEQTPPPGPGSAAPDPGGQGPDPGQGPVAGGQDPLADAGPAEALAEVAASSPPDPEIPENLTGRGRFLLQSITEGNSFIWL